MKTNKLDDIFRDKLRAYEVQPSDRAVEMMMGKLRQQHRSVWIKKWLVAAGLLLLGIGAIWMADILVKTDGDKIFTNVVNKTASGQAEDKVLLEETPAIRLNENNIISEGVVKAIDIENTEKTVNTNVPDIVNELVVEVAKSSEKPVYIEKHPHKQQDEGQMPVVISDFVKDSDTMPDSEQSAVNAQTGNIEKEIVPIKIVYKKTDVVQKQKSNKKNGLFKKGYKKVAAVIDQMNIKDGAKDKLRKTRNDLLAMNPVRLFKKEENQ